MLDQVRDSANDTLYRQQVSLILDRRLRLNTGDMFASAAIGSIRPRHDSALVRASGPRWPTRSWTSTMANSVRRAISVCARRLC